MYAQASPLPAGWSGRASLLECLHVLHVYLTLIFAGVGWWPPFHHHNRPRRVGGGGGMMETVVVWAGL